MNLSSDAVIVNTIKAVGWRQGTLLHLKQNIDINANVTVNAGFYLVISQDCDLVHHSLTNEPFVEILPLTPIEKPDGNFQHGRNPRKIHLTLT
jgi:hypothetical protein